MAKDKSDKSKRIAAAHKKGEIEVLHISEFDDEMVQMIAQTKYGVISDVVSDKDEKQ